MRKSGGQSSVITQQFGRVSVGAASEYSENKHGIGPSKLSKGKLKEESSLNKSSHGQNNQDTNSDSDSSS